MNQNRMTTSRAKSWKKNIWQKKYDSSRKRRKINKNSHLKTNTIVEEKQIKKMS